MADLIQYKRRLPHLLPPGEELFITFRLAGSLPQQLLAQWREEEEQQRNHAERDPNQHYAEQKRYFGRFDAQLAKTEYGPTWLAQPELATMLVQPLRYFDGKGYDLLAYCVMPNHVHLVVRLPIGAPSLLKTLQRLKGYTATQANKLLDRTGAFWQAESYDHVVRKGELPRILSYVVENPVKAGLVEDCQQWPYTYLAPT